LDDAFKFTAALDENGILLFTYSGKFDLQEWIDQYRSELTRLFGDRIDRGFPVVCDIRNLRPTDKDWVENADGVFEFIDKFGTPRGRRALITGGNAEAEISANFFIQYRSAVHDEGSDLRVFDTFEDGYAWARESRTG
tara:strand:+ start:867 stop:1280 length:414 start_codon:yes stop_codon:yes gene_type:complete